MSGNYKQAGDWLFYVNILRYGSIAYSNKRMNYYRVHGNNVSSVFNKKKHIDEIISIYKYYLKEFNINKEQKEKMNCRISFLKKVWGVDGNDE